MHEPEVSLLRALGFVSLIAVSFLEQRDPTAAATIIQRTFRGHLERMRIRAKAEEEAVFLGMKPRSVPLLFRHICCLVSLCFMAHSPDKKDAKYDPVLKSKQIRRTRKRRQVSSVQFLFVEFVFRVLTFSVSGWLAG